MNLSQPDEFHRPNEGFIEIYIGYLFKDPLSRAEHRGNERIRLADLFERKRVSARPVRYCDAQD